MTQALPEKIKAFQKLSESGLLFLNNNSRKVQVKKNRHLYQKGEEKKYVYAVLSGSLKLYGVVEFDKEIIKDIALEGMLFNENIFTPNTNYLESARSLSDAELLEIPINVFEQLLRREPAFASAVLDIMMERVKTLESRIKNFVFKSAKQRIIDYLVRIGHMRGIKIGIDECLIHLGLSHKEIGCVTDTSRQTVARVLSELKSENIIFFSPRKPSKILIRNMQWA